jgi:hypothetical protein
METSPTSGLFTEGSLDNLLRAVGFAEVAVVPNEKRVSRSFASRRERWMWTAGDRLAPWILSELHFHLLEGSYPRVRTVNLLGVATLPDGPPSARGTG